MCFPSSPFALIYFVDGDSIVIVAIANERMKPGYWQDRIRNAADAGTVTSMSGKVYAII